MSIPKARGAKRLEYVRKQERCETLKEFWLQLGGDACEFSYEAVRNYHFDRDAPVAYLAAVRRRYPKYTWAFLTGESDVPTEMHAATEDASVHSNEELTPETSRASQRRVAAQRLWYEIREAMGASDGGGIETQIWGKPTTFLPFFVPPLADLRRRVWTQHLLDASPRMVEDRFQAEEWIGGALGGPLKALGVDPAELDRELMGEYIITMLPALSWIVEAKDRIAEARIMRQSVAIRPFGEVAEAVNARKSERPANKPGNKPAAKRKRS